jgi:hypothetical protein
MRGGSGLLQEVSLIVSQGPSDHLRRMLDHQEKQAAGTSDAPAVVDASVDPQLQIPLIGEVRKPDTARPRRRQARVKAAAQLKLGEP